MTQPSFKYSKFKYYAWFYLAELFFWLGFRLGDHESNKLFHFFGGLGGKCYDHHIDEADRLEIEWKPLWS